MEQQQQNNPALDSDTAIRINREVVCGQKPAVPDTPEMAEFRRRVAAQIGDVMRSGKEVQIPNY